MSKLSSKQQAEVQALYSDHHGWLSRWLRRQLGCSHNAADLAQDTYVRVMGSGRIPNESQARPFLVQVAKGLVVDRYRRQQIERAYLDALAQQPPEVALSPEDQSLTLEALVRIDAMLLGLRPKVRETFLLSRFDGLTYSQIAERLQVSVASVRKYMLEAMQGCMAISLD